ncbi:MAG: VOC family protein [Candidatus Cloacimonetes bacterium]|nr:VOC family protein [Candidatus Cloacimonadota bacterium]
MLKHIGLSIFNYSEIKNFYQDLLGFKIEFDMQISAELSKKVFGIEKETSVYMLSKNDLTLELFLTKHTNVNTYQHLCISVEYRETLIQKARKKGYNCIVIKRDKSDLVFIRDKSNNIFEIKE